MSKQILIDPVTRIEGHSKITIHLNDSGEVQMRNFMSLSSVDLKNFAKAALQ